MVNEQFNNVSANEPYYADEDALRAKCGALATASSPTCSVASPRIWLEFVDVQ